MCTISLHAGCSKIAALWNQTEVTLIGSHRLLDVIPITETAQDGVDMLGSF
jgi:hypothetical protein